MNVLTNKWLIGGVFVLGVALITAGLLKTERPSPTPPPNSYNSVPTQQLPVTTTPTALILPNKEIMSIMTDEEQIVVLSGEIGKNAISVADEISRKALKGKPLFLLISSPGGSVTAGAQIINAMEASPVPVFTVCVDLCASMAAIIHQYGADRFMFDRSILMFHDAAGGFEGYFPHIKSLFATIERYILRFNVYISARSGMPLAELEHNENIQMWVDSEDAITRHFADHIVYMRVMKNKQQLPLKSLMTPLTLPPTKTHFFELTW